MIKRKCIICGQEFDAWISQKMCSKECKRKHKRAYDKDWRKKQKLKAKQEEDAGRPIQ